MGKLISIIIPAYQRIELLKETVQSALTAAADFDAEIIVVDDGSEPALAESLSFPNPVRILRQNNQGLIAAKNNGLAAAEGEYVLFLDSDDLIHPDKLKLQLSAQTIHNADISYCNFTCTNEQNNPQSSSNFPKTHQAYDLLIGLQPPPHVPIFKRSYLNQHLSQPLIKADPFYNPVGEVWIYFNLAAFPASLVHVPQVLSYVRKHSETRISNHWERMGMAGWALSRIFLKKLPEDLRKKELLKVIHLKEFHNYRKLPRNYHALYEHLNVQSWRYQLKVFEDKLGGRFFTPIVQFLGPAPAANLFRRLQRPDYSTIATVTREELNALFQTAQNLIEAA